jgi:hypothetical protein
MPRDSYADSVNKMGLFDKLRLLLEWAPALGRVEDILKETDAHVRAVKIIETLRWAAEKTETPIDDEVLGHVEAILKSPEGESLFGYVVEKVKGAL